MGHATLKLTLDTYGHLWPDESADRARARAVENALQTFHCPGERILALMERAENKPCLGHRAGTLGAPSAVRQLWNGLKKAGNHWVFLQAFEMGFL